MYRNFNNYLFGLRRPFKKIYIFKNNIFYQICKKSIEKSESSSTNV